MKNMEKLMKVKCTNNECKKRETCYRFVISKKLSLSEIEFHEDDAGNCPYYVTIRDGVDKQEEMEESK